LLLVNRLREARFGDQIFAAAYEQQWRSVRIVPADLADPV
jgi:hypothetical protein